jgi:hypothetical protein
MYVVVLSLAVYLVSATAHLCVLIQHRVWKLVALINLTGCNLPYGCFTHVGSDMAERLSAAAAAAAAAAAVPQHGAE